MSRTYDTRGTIEYFYDDEEIQSLADEYNQRIPDKSKCHNIREKMIRADLKYGESITTDGRRVFVCRSNKESFALPFFLMGKIDKCPAKII